MDRDATQNKSQPIKGGFEAVPFRYKLKLVFTILWSALKATLLFLVKGPPRPSWTLGFTLNVSITKSFFTIMDDLSLEIRRLVVPIPEISSDKVVITPVVIPVTPQNFPGVIAELENFEGLQNGEGKRREITGEWICEKELFIRKIQTSEQKVESNSEKDKQVKNDDKVMLYLHGGAYFLASAESYRDITYQLSEAANCRVLAINYRLAPEYPFPAALQDAIHTYTHMINQTEGFGILPNNIVLAGDSAGAGLSVALMMYLRDNNFPAPAGAVLLSPFLDLTLSGASWERNRPYDYFAKVQKFSEPESPSRMYCGGGVSGNDLPEERLVALSRHPYASPVFGDKSRLPPMLIQGGDSELMADDFHKFVNDANVTSDKNAIAPLTYVELDMYKDMVHVFQKFKHPESSRAMARAGAFVRGIFSSE